MLAWGQPVIAGSTVRRVIARTLAATAKLQLSSEEHAALGFLTQVSALQSAAASDAGQPSSNGVEHALN